MTDKENETTEECTADKVAAERKKAATKERNKLRKIFKPVMDDDSYKACEVLIDNIAFMSVSLAEIRDNIRKFGFTEVYDNGGGQTGTKDSVHVRAYNNMLKSYNASCKQLLSAIPKKDRDSVDDGFDSF